MAHTNEQHKVFGVKTAHLVGTKIKTYNLIVLIAILASIKKRVVTTPVLIVQLGIPRIYKRV
jgi:hypothetical protein